MAKVNVKGVQALAKALNRNLRIVLNKIFRDKKLRELVGDIVVRDIKKNVNFGSATVNTQRTREYLERYNTTDPAYRRSDVKAVFSGRLLDDLANNVKGFPTKSTFEISHSKKRHPGYRTANGNTPKIDYQKLSDILIGDLGYDYFQLSDKAQQEILEAVQDKFFEEIKRELT